MEQVTCLARCTQWPPIWTYTNVKHPQSCLFRTKYNSWTGRTDLCFLAWKGLSPTLVQWVYHTPTSVWLFVLLVVHYSLQQTHLDGTIVLCTWKIELKKMCDQNTTQVEGEFKPCRYNDQQLIMVFITSQNHTLTYLNSVTRNQL